MVFHFIVSLLFVVVFNDICLVAAWNPANFSFNPGDDYQLVWQDQFENVGPVKAIINGKPAYAPNPKNWAPIVGMHIDGGLQNFTASIQNAYVQDNKLTIVALKEGLTAAMLASKNLQEFTFGVWAAKIRLPYGQGIWPAWWLVGNADKYSIWWPTCGENDILEMVGGTTRAHTNETDMNAHGTVHWNNQSNTMNPVFNKQIHQVWGTPDGSKLHDNSLVYWSEWTPTKITIGVNEFIYNEFNTIDIPESINPVWAFNGKWPYYMILNIGIGGSWPGPPDDTTVWPQLMVFDWVRVYQKKTIINK
jgi:beta-glucanase (GH16 family)